MCVYFTILFLCYQKGMYKTLMNIEFTTHKIIWLLDVREYTTSYANHPKELIDIITRVANKPCKGNIQCQDLRPKVNWIFSPYALPSTNLQRQQARIWHLKNWRFPKLLFPGMTMLYQLLLCECCSRYCCLQSQFCWPLQLFGNRSPTRKQPRVKHLTVRIKASST